MAGRRSPKGGDPDLIAQAAAELQDAPDMRRGGDMDSGPVAEDRYGGGGHGYVTARLPDDCPVQPLGHYRKTNWVLDHAGQLVELSPKCDKGELMQIFGHRMDWLVDVFPSFGQPQGNNPPPCTGFNQKRVQEAFINACSTAGIFDPSGRVRGRGAHIGKDGELYLHCGDAVYIGGERTLQGKVKPVRLFKTGKIGALVFPTQPAIEPPAQEQASAKVGGALLEILRTWNWKNPYYADLTFHWLATSMLGGALKHRPSIWINGPSGAGKTTLQQMMRTVMGSWAIATEDATEAGLRQLLNQDTLAVMFDEIEPDEGNSAVHLKIIKLARLAYSGGEALRGSVDHKSQSFTARSCFLFSSIHHHQLPAQDRNRMAIVHLSAFPPGAAMKPLPPAIKEWGNQLRRRLLEQWHRFPETLEAYAMAMLREGYSGREQDTYATMLACGDLLLHDEAPNWAEAEMLGKICRADDAVRKLGLILDQARGETESTTERCLRYLTSHRLHAKSGEEQLSIGRWIGRALVQIINGETKASGPAAKLKQYGLKLVHPSDDPDSESAGVEAYMDPKAKPIAVAIAGASHKAMSEIFDGSMWKGGVWSQSLALPTGALSGRKTRFDGPPIRCTVVPIEEMIDVEAAREEAAQVMAERLTGV